MVAAVARLLDGTSLAGSPVLAVSSVDGDGHRRPSARPCVELRDRVRRPCAADATGRLAPRDRPRLLGQGPRRRRDRHAPRAAARAAARRSGSCRATGPSGSARSRSTARRVERRDPGRTALNLAGVEAGDLHRGHGPDRRPGGRSRATGSSSGSARRCRTARGLGVHLGTAAVDASVGRSGRDALDLPDGAAGGDRPAGGARRGRAGRPVRPARGPPGADRIVGGVVLDVAPPRGHLAPAPDRRAGRAACRGGRAGMRRPSRTLASTSTARSTRGRRRRPGPIAADIVGRRRRG